ncbi:transposase [Archaeoglobus sp.]
MHPRALTRLIKRKLYDEIDLKIRPNSVYSKEYILDFLIHTITLNNPTITNGSRHFERTQKGRIIAPNTVFYHLYKLSYDEIGEVFEKANKELMKLAKKVVGRAEVEIAIDSTDWLYYGREVPGVVRVKPREGTSKGFKFMTVNIVEAGMRFTVAIKPVFEFSDEVKILEELIKEVEKWFRIKCIYLDRYFFSVKFITKLQELGLKFVMPAIKNPKIKKLVEQYDAPTIVRYHMGTRGRVAHFNLFIVEGRDGEKVVFASNYPYYYESIIAEKYRRRWGIETSYRVKNGLRLKTCSRKYVVRFFMFCLSVMLYNAWVLLNLLYGFLNFLVVFAEPVIEAQTFLAITLFVQF